MSFLHGEFMTEKKNLKGFLFVISPVSILVIIINPLTTKLKNIIGKQTKRKTQKNQ